jgi:hypothetical protein
LYDGIDDLRETATRIHPEVGPQILDIKHIENGGKSPDARVMT